MSLFGWFNSIFEMGAPTTGVDINPATGLPIVDGTTLDLAGNEFGCSDSTSTPSPGSWDIADGHTTWE